MGLNDETPIVYAVELGREKRGCDIPGCTEPEYKISITGSLWCRQHWLQSREILIDTKMDAGPRF